LHTKSRRREELQDGVRWYSGTSVTSWLCLSLARRAEDQEKVSQDLILAYPILEKVTNFSFRPDVANERLLQHYISMDSFIQVAEYLHFYDYSKARDRNRTCA
jgi:hypothetical protein